MRPPTRCARCARLPARPDAETRFGARPLGKKRCGCPACTEDPGADRADLAILSARARRRGEPRRGDGARVRGGGPRRSRVHRHAVVSGRRHRAAVSRRPPSGRTGRRGRGRARLDLRVGDLAPGEPRAELAVGRARHRAPDRRREGALRPGRRLVAAGHAGAARAARRVRARRAAARRRARRVAGDRRRHGLVDGGLARRAAGRPRRPRAALITCVTETAREQIVARGVDPAKVLLAPNGFDPIVPAAQAPTVPLPGVRDVVYVGNMGLATGLDVVIDAAVLLRADETIRFVLIGGGADAARVRVRAASPGLTNVVFTGPLPRADALRALADATATVVPLVATIADSLPTKLFDAMLVGTPIVLSAAGEARRLVERADAGLTVAPGGPPALAAAVRRVLDDDELRARYRANGPPFVRANYDRAAVMTRLAERVRALSSR